MRAPNRRKRGFTLIETVVTVGIVAALAAVVYPQVVKQFDSADPARVAEDLNNIRTALEAFGVNVRPIQPDDIEDLTLKPDTVTATTLDSTARGATYTVADGQNWIGPYLGLSVPVDAGNEVTAITTGFGALIPNHFALFDLEDATPTGGDTTNTAGVAAADFIAVRVTGMSGAAFNAVNLLIDGPTETSVTTRRQLGRFRCPHVVTSDATACGTAFYLAVPLR